MGKEKEQKREKDKKDELKEGSEDMDKVGKEEKSRVTRKWVSSSTGMNQTRKFLDIYLVFW